MLTSPRAHRRARREQTLSLEFVTYKGKRIALVEIEERSHDEAAALLAEAGATLADLPAGTGLVLTDASQVLFDAATSSAVRAFTARTTRAMKASAVVGADGLRGLALTALARLGGRQVKTCRDRVEALEWLASRA